VQPFLRDAGAVRHARDGRRRFGFRLRLRIRIRIRIRGGLGCGLRIGLGFGFRSRLGDLFLLRVLCVFPKQAHVEAVLLLLFFFFFRLRFRLRLGLAFRSRLRDILLLGFLPVFSVEDALRLFLRLEEVLGVLLVLLVLLNRFVRGEVPVDFVLEVRPGRVGVILQLGFRFRLGLATGLAARGRRLPATTAAFAPGRLALVRVALLGVALLRLALAGVAPVLVALLRVTPVVIALLRVTPVVVPPVLVPVPVAGVGDRSPGGAVSS